MFIVKFPLIVVVVYVATSFVNKDEYNFVYFWFIAQIPAIRCTLAFLVFFCVFIDLSM